MLQNMLGDNDHKIQLTRIGLKLNWNNTNQIMNFEFFNTM